MIFLLLSILSSAAIYVVFKLVDRYRVFTFSAIVINYFVACLAGFFLSNSNPFTLDVFTQKWTPIALLVGVMFIIMFYVIAKSTQKAGVTVTTVAVKMSVVFPIAFSVWYDANDSLSLLKLLGIALALLSVLLTVYKKNGRVFTSRAVLLPAFLFVGMGVVDSFVKYAQSAYITDELASTFSTIVFANALVVGLLILPFNKPALKSIIKVKTWGLGALLGIANFGSIYFLLRALNHIDINTGRQAMGSVVFGINNIGIVALSVIIGFLAYKERPLRINWLGIALSGVSIAVLAVS
ncbi:MAG: DMT family transporter [Tenuifilaceae bacterium]|nr:DMT family transporter [Tenuifilaceae bacterium]